MRDYLLLCHSRQIAGNDNIGGISISYHHLNLSYNIRRDRIAARAFARVPPAGNNFNGSRVSGSGKNIHCPNLGISFTPCRLHARNAVFNHSFFVARRVSDNALNPRFGQTIMAHLLMRMMRPYIHVSLRRYQWHLGNINLIFL